MKTRVISMGLFGLLAASFALPALPADEGSERAREGVRSGRLVKLETLLADAEQRHPGEVLEVELDDGEYEIEILLADGRVVELTYDARSGELLETEIEDEDD